MNSNFEKLLELLGGAMDVSYARALLEWDQETYMPEGAAEGRASQIATLSEIAHKKASSKSVGRLLDALAPQVASLDPDSFEARLVKKARRDYERRVKVPAKLVARTSKATALGLNAWQKARANSDFQLFRPHLERIVELKLEYANLFAPFKHVYDPLLEDYEPGMTAADVKAVFDKLRPELVSLVELAASRPQPDESFLNRDLDEAKQLAFTEEVVSKLGFDWGRGRQDKSAHPFTTCLGPGDERITTRIVPGLPLSSLFSSVHECGHALYEQGFAPKLARTPLADGASLAIHESQSRLWENMVARSKPFWSFFLPRLKKLFPDAFGSVQLEDFLKAVNVVKPSLIRVEADETTYNLHVMLRFELELGMLDGSIAIESLPEEWNARMKSFLGVEPRNDAEGVLQDIHWAMGSIGYFPTYALGNLASAQIWEAAQKELPQLDAQMAAGDFGGLLAWLRKKIHLSGASFEPQELMTRTTGAPLRHDAFVRHLKKRFSEVYGA